MKKRRSDYALLLMRLVWGTLFLLHGFAKILNGISGIESKFEKLDLPGFLAYTVYIGEVIAPLMLILGFRTRLAGLLIAITMVVAVWLSHSGDLFLLTKGGGWALELQAFYFFGSVVLLMLGGGKYAVSKRSKWD